MEQFSKPALYPNLLQLQSHHQIPRHCTTPPPRSPPPLPPHIGTENSSQHATEPPEPQTCSYMKCGPSMQLPSNGGEKTIYLIFAVLEIWKFAFPTFPFTYVWKQADSAGRLGGWAVYSIVTCLDFFLPSSSLRPSFAP